jgi:hypothetical protein
MIADLAAARQALGGKKPVENVVRAADFVLKSLRAKNGRHLRSYGAAPGQKRGGPPERLPRRLRLLRPEAGFSRSEFPDADLFRGRTRWYRGLAITHQRLF